MVGSVGAARRATASRPPRSAGWPAWSRRWSPPRDSARRRRRAPAPPSPAVRSARRASPSSAAGGGPSRSSASLFLGLFDQLGDAVEIVVGELLAGALDERGHHVGHRPFEEGGQEMIECTLPRLVAVEGGAVDVARAVVLVAQQALLL